MSAATQLLERCLAGEPGAIETVFHTYRRPVFRLAYATLLDHEMAGRAMQAALNSVLGALRQGMSEEDFQVVLFQHVLKACRAERRQSGWQKRLAGLRIGNWLGGRKAGQALRGAGAWKAAGSPSAPKEQAAPDIQAAPDKPAGRVEHAAPIEPAVFHDAVTHRKQGLWKAIGRLPEEQRVALALRYEFELPLAQAARVMRSSPGVVHARLSAARHTLSAALDALQSSTPPPGPGQAPGRAQP